jgi:hypothetical protein
MIDIEGPLIISLEGGAHIGARALLDIELIWYGYIARLSSGEEGDILLVQMISTCLRSA